MWHISPPPQSSLIYIVGVTFSFDCQNRTVCTIERNHKNSPWVQAGIKRIAKMPNQQSKSNSCLLHSQLECTILLPFQRKLLPQIQLHPAQLRNKAINRNNTLSERVLSIGEQRRQFTPVPFREIKVSLHYYLCKFGDCSDLLV